MKNLTALLISLLIFAACSENKQEQITTGQGIQFTSNISGSVNTRAANATWDPDDLIGIYMFAHQPGGGAAELEYAYRQNVPYRTTDGGTTATFSAAITPLEFPLNGTRVNFAAYYPHREDLHDFYNHIYQVNVSEQGWPSAIDLLYCYTQTPYTKDSGSVPLVFGHQLSKLVFIITPTEGVDIDLTDAGSELFGLPTTAKFALADGSLYDLGGTATPSSPLIPIKNTELSTSEKIVFEAIVIPNKGSDYPLSSGNPRCFYFTAGGTDYTYTFPDNRDMEKGTAHSYNFTLTTTELILTQTSIVDWNNNASDLLLPPSLNKYTVSEPVPATFELSDAVCTETFIITTNSPEETATVKYSTTGNPNRATDLPDWLTVTPTYTDNGETNARTWTLTTNIGRNLSAEKRTFYIHVTIDGYEKIVEVTQNDFLPITITGEPANCYIMSPGDQLLIPISRVAEFRAKGYSTEHPVLEEGEEFYPMIYWTDGSNVLCTTNPITAVGTGPNAYLQVNVGKQEGNAVVGIQKKMEDESFVTLWSWHVWVTTYTGSTTWENNGFTFMDRNLGATEAALSLAGRGLFYQWGRKDPFPGGKAGMAGYAALNAFKGMPDAGSTDVITVSSDNNADGILESIQNPTTFYITKADRNWLPIRDNTLWGHGTGTAKAIYDPCPKGWRVPSHKVAIDQEISNEDFPWFGIPTQPMNGDDTSGSNWGTNALYPSAGARYMDGEYSMADRGHYWTASPNDSYASCLFIGNHVGGRAGMNRAMGFSVRCVSE